MERKATASFFVRIKCESNLVLPWVQNPMEGVGKAEGYFLHGRVSLHALLAMRVIKLSPILSVLLLGLAAGCAENKTVKTGSPSPTFTSTAAATNAPPEQQLTPTSDRPDAQRHIYSNSTSRASSPSSSPENP